MTGSDQANNGLESQTVSGATLYRFRLLQLRGSPSRIPGSTSGYKNGSYKGGWSHRPSKLARADARLQQGTDGTLGPTIRTFGLVPLRILKSQIL